MFVSDLMNTNVITVEPENTLADAARIMLAQHVSGLPVLDAGRLVGVITEGDLLRRVEIDTAPREAGWFKAFVMPSRLANDYVHTHGQHVRDVMSSTPISVTPTTSLDEVADIMVTKHIKRLPVLADGKLVGVISRTDMLRALARRLIDHDDPYTETQIKEHIVATMARERWAPKSGIRINVTGKVVDLEGAVFSAAEQQAIRVIAETTPGVEEVRDHLLFIDPGSGLAFPAA
jgi:CBS domain-containing protein